MSEGPLNFGKPLAILVLLACIGGGVYAYLHWPAHYEDPQGWEISFPNKWETTPFPDPAIPGKVVARGPLLEEGQEGVAWGAIFRHGTLDWPGFVLANVPGTLDKSEEIEIDHKKTLIFEYEENNAIRYKGAAVQRGDALVIVAIGCQKPLFFTNVERFEKVLKTIKCSR